MTVLLALTAGLFFAGGLQQLMQRSLPRTLVGLLLLGNGANLAVFTAAGPQGQTPPLTPPGAVAPPPGAADPLPQALVLTAIVISFALVAFAGTLLLRAHEAIDSDDLDAMRTTDT
jgi:multicomponent Na+:H+ antiporter subunit C